MKLKAEKKETKPTTDIVKTQILSSEMLTERFKEVSIKLPELEKISAELKVTNDETLVIGTNNIVTINEYIKNVEATRKLLKQPSLQEGKMIDEYCSKISTVLERAKKRVTSEVTNYKVLQEARERQEQAKKLEELQKIEKAKKDESELILRIEKQMNARLYGGIYFTGSGERKSSAGCIKSTDCKSLHEMLNTKLPDMSSFKYFPERYEDVIRKMAKKISEHETNLIDVEGVLDNKRSIALERIAQARSESEVESMESKEEMESQIMKESKKEERKSENIVMQAGKGVHSIVKFKVIDETIVPRDLFVIDNTKITAYLNENRDKIKEDIRKNEDTLPGIKFYVEDTFIAR